MVTLEIYDSEKHYQDLTIYDLEEEQKQFTEIPRNIFKDENIIHNPAKNLITILFETIPVGLFILDQGEDKFQ